MYLCTVVSDEGSKSYILSRIAQATAALTKLKPIWRNSIISKRSWTLAAELEKKMQAFEMRCYRGLLNISYKDHATNEEVRRKIRAAT